MDNTTDTNELEKQVWINFLEKTLNEDTQWPQVLVPSLMLLIFIVSLVGNLLTCSVIYYDKTMHTATNNYLFNLAVSDLLVTLAIPLTVYEYFGSDSQTWQYRFGELACKIHYFLLSALFNNAVLIMTALAVERYVAICHPLMLQSISVWRRVLKIMAIIWIVAVAEAVPETWSVNLIQTKKSSMCLVVPTRFAKIVSAMLAILTFLIPLIIMSFVYTMIAFKINIVQKNAFKNGIFNQRDNRSKVNKLITLTVAFLVCWFPFFLVRISFIVWDAKQLIKADKWWLVLLYKIASLNSWLSVVLNPLLFSVMSTKFRQSLKALWNRRIKQQYPELYTSRATIHL